MNIRFGLLAVLMVIAQAGTPALALGVSFKVGTTSSVAGDGELKHESRLITGITTITADSAVDLIVREGPIPALDIEADGNLLPLVRTTTSGSDLKITVTNSFSSSRPLVARVTLPSLSRLSVSGPGDIDVAGLKDDVVDIQLNGSGDLRLSGHPRMLRLAADGSGDISLNGVNTERIEATLAGTGEVRLSRVQTDVLAIILSGSGDVEANGTVEDLELTSNGSGEFVATRLAARNARIVMHGSGNAQVHVARELEATVAGSGTLDVTGAPTRQKLAVNGSGALHFHK